MSHKSVHWLTHRAPMISQTVWALGAFRLISMERIPNRRIWTQAPVARTLLIFVGGGRKECVMSEYVLYVVCCMCMFGGLS